jgi:hypothetical protein
MKKYTSEELRQILAAHKLWLENRYQAGARRADLICADLRGAYLRGADLSRANLRGANLSNADLSGANLRGADLSNADLSEANLRGADLRGANLSNADLSEANLRGADLSGVDLSYADLRGAYLRGADLSCTIGILCASCHWTDHGECGRSILAYWQTEKMPEPEYQCGCFRGTLQELRSYIESGEEQYKASRTLAADFLSDRMAEMMDNREGAQS